jgi:hypothetical protein
VIELGVFGIVGACFVALIWKLAAMFKVDKADLLDEVAKRNEPIFKVEKLEREEAKKEGDILQVKLQKEGVSEQLMINLRERQERLKDDAATHFDGNGSKLK